ncbi:MAG: response regulator transcription factor [Clostridiales bacterium]|nr:response regulator transcription factor [Clostridiales bacterium]
MKILIAEDDLVSRNFLSQFLARYGDCDLVVDGLEALDAFLIALKDRAPYQLILLDIMMPKADGMQTLKAIRALERQSGTAPEHRVKVIMTTALAEAQLVQTAFDYGCEAYATKPIDTKKLLEVMEKLGLIDEAARRRGTKGPEPDSNFDKNADFTTKHGMQGQDFLPILSNEADRMKEGYFKCVRALPDHQLEVVMETGTTIYFDFRSRLDTARFGKLRDEELFGNVRTDGNYLVFERAGQTPVKITASEFMDLVLIDRRK